MRKGLKVGIYVLGCAATISCGFLFCHLQAGLCDINLSSALTAIAILGSAFTRLAACRLTRRVEIP